MRGWQFGAIVVKTRQRPECLCRFFCSHHSNERTLLPPSSSLSFPFIPALAQVMLRFIAFPALIMPIKEKNYWLETVVTPAVATSPEVPDSVDVAVVGAGFCGLSAARTLAKRGAKVAVLEAETFGWGASSRNGGMVLTGMKLPVPALLNHYGRGNSPKNYAAPRDATAS